MKITISLLVAFIAVIGLQIASNYATSPASDPLQLRDLDRYVRITEQAHEMQDSTILFCKPPKEMGLNPHEPVIPAKAFCNVYVNEKAKEPISSGQGLYPEGSVVIKSKIASPDNQYPILFTVMEKMADGYDSDHGNWKYTVVDGKSYRPLASGRIDSCIDCHKHYESTDYITREYIKD